MLTSIVLKTSSVRLSDAAKVSIMRANNPRPRALLDLIPALSGQGCLEGRLKTTVYCLAVLLLFGTTTTLQFSSTLFLSDLHLGRLPDLPEKRSVAYDFDYGKSNEVEIIAPGLALDNTYSGDYPIQRRGPTWLRNPSAFPAFAEYSKEVSPLEGVDDTGVLLRALLPLPEAQSRETIQNYSGDAFVLDSRVGDR